MAKNKLRRWFNVRAWCDYDRLAQGAFSLRDTIRLLFIPRTTTKKEDFANAIEKLQFSEEDIQVRKHAFLRLTLIMSTMTLLIFCYSLYHLYEGHIRTFVMSVILSLIAAMLTFRYHFWYFQLTKKKLGCTLNEWFLEGFLRRKP